jgi:beta-N-acetylhexosaminidase
MTGHIVYPAIDPAAPATLSATVIARVIRGRIGFDGLLLSDDVNMNALRGELAQRATASLAAGCDVALQCSGRFEEMAAVLAACPPMTAAAWQRWDRAGRGIPAPQPIDRAEAMRELSALLASAAT